MIQNSLEKFIEGIKEIWGPLNSQTVAKSQALLSELARAPQSEAWLADLLQNAPEEKELYRDPENGFVLLAYTEQEGQYRIPHDHGSGWVVYAVQSGVMEMVEYKQFINQKGHFGIVRREAYRLQAGDCRVYLPGDIHDTKSISGPVLMFRLSSCDLKKESREGRMIRYSDQE